MTKEISAKEKLFCTYYHVGRCGREAAAKSGYRFPERSAQKLLRRADVRAYLDALDKQHKGTDADVIAGYRRLAFGCVSDAVRLLLADEIDLQTLDDLDLFLISDIKRPKGGGLEIKFFDRLKALERLEALVCGEASEGAANFYSAIGKGAAALAEERNGA